MLSRSSGSLTIRTVELQDKESWLHLFHQYILFYESILSDEQYELTWQRLFDNNCPIYGLVAVYNENIVGIAHYLFHPSTWSDSDHCYLQDLFVNSSVRGLGIGKRLIQEVQQIAKSRGSSRLYWNTKVDNTQARALYDTFTPASDFVQYRLPISQDKI